MKNSGMCPVLSLRIREFSPTYSQNKWPKHIALQWGKESWSLSSDVTCSTFLERKAAEFAHEQCYHLGSVLCRAEGKFRCRSRKDCANSLMELAWTSSSEAKSLCWREAELFQECGGMQRALGGKLKTVVGDGCTHSPAIISCPECTSHFFIL